MHKSTKKMVNAFTTNTLRLLIQECRKLFIDSNDAKSFRSLQNIPLHGSAVVTAFVVIATIVVGVTVSVVGTTVVGGIATVVGVTAEGTIVVGGIAAVVVWIQFTIQEINNELYTYYSCRYTVQSTWNNNHNWQYRNYFFFVCPVLAFF